MTSRPLAIGFYGLLFEALSPLWRWWLKQRLKRGKETPTSVSQRWMLNPPPRPQGTLIWGHAVGVGEALALAGLLKRLQEQRPDLHFLITTTARTSGEALSNQQLGNRFTHWFAPVDTPSNVARFLDHWQPNLALWCEMDLWPVLIEATARRGTPHVLVNARLSQEAVAKRRWGRALYAPLMAGFNTIWAQNAETARHLLSLGAHPGRMEITGTIKAMVPPLTTNESNLIDWQQTLGTRPVWLLASSHPGEEELALSAHQLLMREFPNALLILAPRDARRGALVAALCGPGTPIRSQGALLADQSPCYVADTMGELGLWYRLSRVAMVGGSWSPVGGHNPYEATALGNTVLHGAYVSNFSESYADLDAQGMSVEVNDAEAIANRVAEVWMASRYSEISNETSIEHSAIRVQKLLSLLPN